MTQRVKQTIIRDIVPPLAQRRVLPLQRNDWRFLPIRPPASVWSSSLRKLFLAICPVNSPRMREWLNRLKTE